MCQVSVCQMCLGQVSVCQLSLCKASVCVKCLCVSVSLPPTSPSSKKDFKEFLVAHFLLVVRNMVKDKRL